MKMFIYENILFYATMFLKICLYLLQVLACSSNSRAHPTCDASTGSLTATDPCSLITCVNELVPWEAIFGMEHATERG